MSGIQTVFTHQQGEPMGWWGWPGREHHQDIPWGAPLLEVSAWHPSSIGWCLRSQLLCTSYRLLSGL